MSRTFSEDLVTDLQNRETAHDFGEAIAKVDIAFTLSEARRGNGVTQKELASRVGTTQSYIAKLERGDANPSIGRIGRLLAALGMRLSTSVIPLMGLGRTYPVQPTLSSGTASFHWDVALQRMVNPENRTQSPSSILIWSQVR